MRIRNLLNTLLQKQIDWSAYCQPLPDCSGVDILRLDLLHPLLQGNKALKLAGWWQHFERGNYKKIITFGGPFSNHLHATAAFARALDIELLCMVRGYAAAPLTPTLRDCLAWGAQLEFLDRSEYGLRYQHGYRQQLARQHQALVIPEGGAGSAGELACAGLAEFVGAYDEFWLAAGSGTTALGVAHELARLVFATRLVAVNVVADQGELQRQWQQRMPSGVDWRITDGSLGGFARQTPELGKLLEHYDHLGLPLDPVYTGKLLLAFLRHQQHGVNGRYRVLLLHSGGLQGRNR